MQLLYFVYGSNKDTQLTSKPPCESYYKAVPVDVVRHVFIRSSAAVLWFLRS